MALEFSFQIKTGTKMLIKNKETLEYKIGFFEGFEVSDERIKYILITEEGVVLKFKINNYLIEKVSN